MRVTMATGFAGKFVKVHDTVAGDSVCIPLDDIPELCNRLMELRRKELTTPALRVLP